MICNVIATGSTGNATLLDGKILIDCGVPYKKIEPYIGQLRLVLLTHIHGDHFNPGTIKRMALMRPLLRFACAPWMVGPLLSTGVKPTQIDVIPAGGFRCRYQQYATVEWFPLYHDVENCGWKIDINGEKAIYATDTTSLAGVSAKGYDLYLIEANYVEAELEARIAAKMEAGEFCYETRAKESHLSREQADTWLAENAGPGCEIRYMHGHVDKPRHDTTEEVINA